MVVVVPVVLPRAARRRCGGRAPDRLAQGEQGLLLLPTVQPSTSTSTSSGTPHTTQASAAPAAARVHGAVRLVLLIPRLL
jgi:hypothetical protein